MSYNLLFDTNISTFGNNNSLWKYKNCSYKDGYLIADNNTVYAISQEMVLSDITKVYASFDYIALDKNIKSVTVGILENDTLHSTVKKPTIRKRKRISVVHDTALEKITVMFIVEATKPYTKIYIDSPLLVDLKAANKAFWPKGFLNKILDYRYGCDYKNLYKESELTTNNEDFKSAYSLVEPAKVGVVVTLDLLDKNHMKDWFQLDCKLDAGKIYLVKLDYEEINNCGSVYLSYGDWLSSQVKDQQFIVIQGDPTARLRIYLEKTEELPYRINLKHILIIDLTNQQITEADIPHLPFV